MSNLKKITLTCNCCLTEGGTITYGSENLEIFDFRCDNCLLIERMYRDRHDNEARKNYHQKLQEAKAYFKKHGGLNEDSK